MCASRPVTRRRYVCLQPTVRSSPTHPPTYRLVFFHPPTHPPTHLPIHRALENTNNAVVWVYEPLSAGGGGGGGGPQTRWNGAERGRLNRRIVLGRNPKAQPATRDTHAAAPPASNRSTARRQQRSSDPTPFSRLNTFVPTHKHRAIPSHFRRLVGRPWRQTRVRFSQPESTDRARAAVGHMGRREEQTSIGACEEGGIAAVHIHHDCDDDDEEEEEDQAWGPENGAGAAESTDAHPHHHRLRRQSQRQRQRWCCCRPPPSGPAAHFWGKLQMALRTALATGGAAVVCLGYWSWAGPEYSWFSIILCIIATRSTLVRCWCGGVRVGQGPNQSTDPHTYMYT